MGSIKCSRNTSFSFFFIFFIVSGFAFGTRNWYKYESDILDTKIYRGLWQECTDSELFDEIRCETSGFDMERDSLFIGTQIAMCVAVGCYLISFICYCVWMSMSQQFLEENGAGSSGNAALSFALIGGLSNLSAVAQYGAYISEAEKLNYSYYLAVASCAVMTLNSIITLGTTSCCFTPQREQPVVVSTTTPPHYGEAAIMTSEASYLNGQPMSGYPVQQISQHPYAGPHTNQGYVPGTQNLYTKNPSAPLSHVANMPPPDYNMLHQYPTIPRPDYPGRVYPNLMEPNPDYLDTSFGHPATHM